MGKPGGRKKGGNKKKNHNMGKRWKVKYERKYKDIDEIDADLAPMNAANLLTQRINYEMPGEGQHYCIHCAIYFINKVTLAVHLKTKAHRKRVKELRFTPHSQEEADRAAGMGNFIMPGERIVRNLTVDDQIRDERYLDEENKDEQDKISASLSKLPAGKKKRKPSMFISVKSKKEVV